MPRAAGLHLPRRPRRQKSAVVVDPEIRGGRPSVGGISPEALREQSDGGETVDDLADTYPEELRSGVVALARKREAPGPRSRSVPGRQPKMMFPRKREVPPPLVRDLAATTARIRVPVAVTCRVLGFSKQAFYQWLPKPGDFIADRPVNFFIHPAGLPINTSTIKVLRRPVKSAQFRSKKFVRVLANNGLLGSMGRVASCGDNAAMELFFA